jgi:NAD(P)-dependent dehydrogenase (short-subunit alcohol dehydrogenase family)
MKLREKVVVVTGGASGIGRSLALRFAAEGARALVIADLDLAAAQDVAGSVGGLAVKTDVSDENDLNSLIDQTLDRYGRIDLFCSNAGIGGVPGFEQVSNEDWERIWRINVMGHVYAARAVLPAMLARGEGYLLNTASAAGLLTQIGSAPYSVTKHAAVAFAEWLAITYGDRGIKVSCLCPQGVLTPMLTAAAEQGSGAFLLDGALAPEEVADSVVKALDREQFLILPHPEVARYFQNKASDYERWLAGMRKLQVKNEALKK